MIMSYDFGSLPSESDEQDDVIGGGGGGSGAGGLLVGRQTQLVKKRFRTKFTQEQKEKMFNFAEKAGWKIQKQEESVVQQFCQEIGVKRRVLKVWMHNNKHNFLGGHSARRSASASATAGAAPHQTPGANAGAAATPPSFNPSRITPPPPVLTSSPTAATGFNINGAASSAPTTATGADHTDNANGASSPQSA